MWKLGQPLIFAIIIIIIIIIGIWLCNLHNMFLLTSRKRTNLPELRKGGKGNMGNAQKERLFWGRLSFYPSNNFLVCSARVTTIRKMKMIMLAPWQVCKPIDTFPISVLQGAGHTIIKAAMDSGTKKLNLKTQPFAGKLFPLKNSE